MMSAAVSAGTRNKRIGNCDVSLLADARQRVVFTEKTNDRAFFAPLGLKCRRYAANAAGDLESALFEVLCLKFC